MRSALILFVSGCGLGWIGGEDDRAAGLPTSGAGPYERLESDDTTPAVEPKFLDETGASIEDPHMLAGGSGLRVWFTRATSDPVSSEIQYVEATSAHALPSEPSTVLEATEAWEEGVVSAPSVIEDPDGGLVMFYEGGIATPSIGRATSVDGITWQKDGLPLLIGASSPSAVVAYGEMWLFATRASEVGIWRAVDRGGGFAFDAAPVVVPRPEQPEAFDLVAVSEPFALAVPTLEPGVTRVHLWFAGTTDVPLAATTIGYAASFDGLAWHRFGGVNPMITADATAPTVALEPAGGLMLFAEPIGSSRFGLVAAGHGKL